MDYIEFQYLERRFDELFLYCDLCDKSDIPLRNSMKMCDVFLLDITCYLLYLSSSTRNLLNRLYFFRDSMDCNRIVLEQIIEILCDNLNYAEDHFGNPLVVQRLLVEDIRGSEKYIPLFFDFFRMLGLAMVDG